MTFLPEFGADKNISLDSRFSHSLNGFIMVPCMTDLVE